jgi:phosphatidylglycerol:prolipoprotein diacylglycerol transferase
VTTVAWAVVFPITDPRTGLVVDYTAPRHPSQLYQAGLEGLILLIYLQARFWLSKPEQRPAGRLAAEFLVAYGFLRILGEIFREPDAALLLGLSRGTFYSLLMMVAGVLLIGRSAKK